MRSLSVGGSAAAALLVGLSAFGIFTAYSLAVCVALALYVVVLERRFHLPVRLSASG